MFVLDLPDEDMYKPGVNPLDSISYTDAFWGLVVWVIVIAVFLILCFGLHREFAFGVKQWIAYLKIDEEPLEQAPRERKPREPLFTMVECPMCYQDKTQPCPTCRGAREVRRYRDRG